MAKNTANYIPPIDLSQWPVLSEEEERETAIRVSQGDQEARDKMILHNQRLVYKEAYKFNWNGLDLNDLISEGQIALAKAVNSYDLSKGFRFSTYALSAIHNRILHFITSQKEPVKLPANIHKNIADVSKAWRQYVKDNDAEPDEEELSVLTGLSVVDVQEALLLNKGLLSIDQPTGTDSEDGDGTIGETLSDTKKEGEIAASSLSAEVEDALSSLNEKEMKILCMLEGYGCDQKSPAEISEITGLSRERIAQIVKKAKDRMAFHLKELDPKKNS